MKKQDKVMFLYEKLGMKSKAILYCSLHNVLLINNSYLVKILNAKNVNIIKI